MRPGGLEPARPGLRGAARGQPQDRLPDDLRLRHDRPLPRLPEPRHRVRHLGRRREPGGRRGRASPTSPSTSRSASTPARCTARSASWPASCRPARPVEGCRLEVAQSDAAAAIDWLRSETYRAYERPQSEVTGNASDDYRRRAPGTAGMKRRRPLQHLRDHRRPRAFHGVRASVLEELLRGRRPRRAVREVARRAVRRPRAAATSSCTHELREIFKHARPRRSGSSSAASSTPRSRPVNTPQTLINDPQFQDRMPWIPKEQLGADHAAVPGQGGRRRAAVARPRAPTLGQHTDEVLAERARLRRRDRIAALRGAGALGTTE